MSCAMQVHERWMPFVMSKNLSSIWCVGVLLKHQYFGHVCFQPTFVFILFLCHLSCKFGVIFVALFQ